MQRDKILLFDLEAEIRGLKRQTQYITVGCGQSLSLNLSFLSNQIKQDSYLTSKITTVTTHHNLVKEVEQGYVWMWFYQKGLQRTTGEYQALPVARTKISA